MKKQSKIDILEVKISVTSKSQLLKEIEKKLVSGTKFSILTPNPELVLMAQGNPRLMKALNSATFAIPDGVGLKAAKWDLEIIKGRELFLDLIKLANKKKLRVFLLGGKDNEAELTARKLVKRYKDIKILSEGGPQVTTSLSKDIVDKINKFSPDLLFVAFYNPHQEIFIMQNAQKLNAKCMMAVGGTFRYLAGMSKLPPKAFSFLGLEWVWRLITEPYRFRRILNAFPIFPIKVWLWKLKKLGVYSFAVILLIDSLGKIDLH